LYKACNSILKALAYFNIFSYPLTKEEIIKYLDSIYTEAEYEAAFRFLETEKIIFNDGGYYSLMNDPLLAKRRVKGNTIALQQMRIAEKVAKLLSGFPFVRSVAVSGSLSKNYAEEKSDIDIFIITAVNRLWIARTFMHVFKKLTFLAGRQHWFCMNYYVDEAGLEIKEKNIFTATEIATAIPLRGESTFRQFLDANNWVTGFFPHFTPDTTKCQKSKKGFIKAIFEFVLHNRFGNWLDNWLMFHTVKRWNRKTRQGKRYKNGAIMGMDAGKHFSKPLLQNTQEKVLACYQLKLKQLMMMTESISSSSIA
jgi:predicted nucleotidyltransferase